MSRHSRESSRKDQSLVCMQKLPNFFSLINYFFSFKCNVSHIADLFLGHINEVRLVLHLFQLEPGWKYYNNSDPASNTNMPPSTPVIRCARLTCKVGG